jgi:NADH-quinone oxidoreductase subunit E
MTDPFQPRHPDITEPMWDQINETIQKNRYKKGCVITVLRECQAIVGYLPVELMNHIARNLNLSSSEVFGVASFYSLFSFVPKGRHTVKVCLGTACYVKGIKEVVSRISYAYKIKEGDTTEDRRFSMEGVRCLGACGLAPVMVVDKDTHGAISADKVIDILERYK